ncbi:tRNA 5-methoxyuridine(34)/uridine 5-oxyacetic acid(34) synthase CmoB [Thioflexithrix psekupsensis]|uniref:tRNA 5-methoxyuridine(34)/uridine 5-oxyacetic acid(34) synthase CmoB n=1 Tax=Thioflexithrix psekupsensis TaxID=1570016 RepID=UPI000A37645A|nr:tRNA 5-methoxyuridine(34)/uridine 5-oxyacetic acid(34) synthase CmoB [Thioflexithrix psekupsensis]
MEKLIIQDELNNLGYLDSLQQLAHWPALSPWLAQLELELKRCFDPNYHGHLSEWLAVLKQLPELKNSSIDLQAGSIRAGEPPDCSPEQYEFIRGLLKQLHPWRKGPFLMHGIYIDTEWRSDWKWERLSGKISPLKGRLVLDVGCGNGYHCWRMVGEGARWVVGIDPTLISVMQFHAIRHFLGKQWPVMIFPVGVETLTPKMQIFDTVFSMGILYHRQSPLGHLLELRDCLRRGGELVLETLVIDGDERMVLLPENRYAQMRNVWFIPSCAALALWLKRCGFSDIQLINISPTTPQEQRQTEWMRFHSLTEALDPNCPEKTIENLPAPKRAIFRARVN